MAAIRSAARRILGRALAQRPPGVDLAQPQRLLPRMLLHGGLLGRRPRPPPLLVGSSRLFSSSGGHGTTQGSPNEDFASCAATKKLMEELEEKRVELLLVLKKMESVSGDPSLLSELEKKNNELFHVLNKILASNKPEELRDLIVETLQDTGAQQDRSRAEFGMELLLTGACGVMVAVMLVMIQAKRMVRRLKMCLVAIAGVHVVAGTWYLMSRPTPAAAEARVLEVVHGGDIGGGNHAAIETVQADDHCSFYPRQ